MAIAALGSGLGVKKEDDALFLQEQKRRELHYVVSVTTDIDWTHHTFRINLSKLKYPRGRLVALHLKRYPAKNYSEGALQGDEPKIVLHESIPADQVNEVLMIDDNRSVVYLSPLRGLDPVLIAQMEPWLLPESTDEKEFSYKKLIGYLIKKERELNAAVKAQDENVLTIAPILKETFVEFKEKLGKIRETLTKKIAEVDREISKALTGQNGTTSYDETDIKYMQFLEVKAKHPVSPDTGLTMEKPQEIIVQQPTQSGDTAALQAQVLALSQQVQTLSKVAASAVAERAMKRCDQCAADIYMEAKKCRYCSAVQETPTSATPAPATNITTAVKEKTKEKEKEKEKSKGEEK